MSLSLSKKHEFSIITLDRPDALNALNEYTLKELMRAIEDVKNSDSRALIIAGAGGKAFCAGADIKEMRARTLKAQRDGIAFGQAVFRKLEILGIPSIAAIDGVALGGGLELALACTFRIATEKSVMGLPEIKLGLIPGFGGTQRLPRLIGQARALEIIMTGKRLNASEALSIGLINRIVGNQYIEEAFQFARQFSSYSLLALSFAKEAIQRSLDNPIDHGLQVEADLISMAFQTKDAHEGMNAFFEKRSPKFTDE